MRTKSKVGFERLELCTNTARRRLQRGVAAVEFAVVLPLLLLVLFAIVEFGLALFDKQVISSATGSAARAGILFAASSTATVLPHTSFGNVCTTALNGTSTVMSLNGSPSTTITISDVTSGTSAACTTATSSTASSLCTNSGDQIEVQISATFGGLLLGGALNPLASTSNNSLAMNSTTYGICE